MPDYLARIVLHRIDDSDDYTELHDEMEKIGFRKTAINYDPRFAHNAIKMPPGTYLFDSKLPVNTHRCSTLDDAYDAVNKAVNNVTADETVYIRRANNPPTVLVAQIAGARWFLETDNLESNS